MPSLGIEPGPHWVEATALTTVLALLLNNSLLLFIWSHRLAVWQPKAAHDNGLRPADFSYHLNLQKDRSVLHREAFRFPEFVNLAILKDDRSCDDSSPIASCARIFPQTGLSLKPCPENTITKLKN